MRNKKITMEYKERDHRSKKIEARCTDLYSCRTNKKVYKGDFTLGEEN